VTDRRESLKKALQMSTAVMAAFNPTDAAAFLQNADELAEAVAQRAEQDPQYAAIVDDLFRPRTAEEILAGYAAVNRLRAEGGSDAR